MKEKRSWFYGIVLSLVAVSLAAGTAFAATVALKTPRPNAVIEQNNPATNCPYNVNSGYGYVVTFDWHDYHPAGQVASYRLLVQHVGSPFPAVNKTVTQTTYTWLACGFVIDANLSNWQWQVSALDAGGNVLATSEAWPFSFAPCRLTNGTPCSAPPPP